MTAHVEWAIFKKRLHPAPNRRTGRRWVEECGVIGEVVEHPDGAYLVYIDVAAWEAGVRAPKAVNPRVLALVG